MDKIINNKNNKLEKNLMNKLIMIFLMKKIVIKKIRMKISYLILYKKYDIIKNLIFKINLIN